MNTDINFLISKIKKNKLRNPKISYTSFLVNKGEKYCLNKIKEECLELVSSAMSNKKNIIHESADLIYHLLVLLELKRVSFFKVIKELKRRTKFSGIIEKKNRKNVRRK